MKTCLETAGLKLKAKKCKLFSKRVNYLGHVISTEGISTDRTNVVMIIEWPTPSSVNELRSFVELYSYYRRFVLDFAKIAKPLHRLTEKGRQFIWTAECEKAFVLLKTKMTSAPIFAMPDFEKPFTLDTDAGAYAMGAVLSQVINGIERPIVFASKTMSKSENKCNQEGAISSGYVY